MTHPPRRTGGRTWEVLLIGGASGSGKTSLAYRLAHHFGVGITEADDIHVALIHMTTPEQQPLLHLWDTDPATRHWSPEQILAHFIRVCEQLTPAYEAVIANHLESDVPFILEGDYLLPALAAQRTFGDYSNHGRVRGLFIHEEDEEQFVQNYLAREPESGRQDFRARVSWLHSQWLVQQAAQVGGMVVPARPWETGLARVLANLDNV
jgi:2-phosphoglycerate kinase